MFSISPMKLKSLTASLLVVSVVAVSPASAGGLFGKGGPFRGSVGNFINKHIEEPILTPVARAATVAIGATVGAAAGTVVGAPKAGAVVGAAVGQAINEKAAGK